MKRVGERWLVVCTWLTAILLAPNSGFWLVRRWWLIYNYWNLQQEKFRLRSQGLCRRPESGSQTRFFYVSWIINECVRKKTYKSIKTIEESVGKGEAGQASCSLCLGGSWPGFLFRDVHQRKICMSRRNSASNRVTTQC